MMAELPISREELFALAASPIGGKDVQELADTAAQCRVEKKHLPPAVKEAAKRAAKIWLPRGRTPAKRPAESAAVQIDLEDAVVAAGGKRGSLA